MSGQLKGKKPQEAKKEEGWILQPEVHFNSSRPLEETATSELNKIIGENQFDLRVIKEPFLQTKTTC